VEGVEEKSLEDESLEDESDPESDGGGGFRLSLLGGGMEEKRGRGKGEAERVRRQSKEGKTSWLTRRSIERMASWSARSTKEGKASLETGEGEKDEPLGRSAAWIPGPYNAQSAIIIIARGEVCVRGCRGRRV
jgi:hypothetical protein